MPPLPPHPCKDWFLVSVLCFLNLLNYMDRVILAGILYEIQQYFQLTDDQVGLLQTVFTLSFMVCAPIFGYFGDRYSRIWLSILGVTLWSGATLLGSYVNHFGLLLASRVIVGMGQTSFTAIAPTIISDLFVHNLRTKMLMLFYFAIPVGCGLGYIVGSETANAIGSWRWGLRVTPALGLLGIILIACFKDPDRGQSENIGIIERTSYSDDLKYVARNKSYVLLTVGVTCVTFVTGILAWWGPIFIYLGFKLQKQNHHDVHQHDVSYVFGIVAMLTGLIGVPTGAVLAQKLRRYWKTIDPIISGVGLVVSAPFIFFALIIARHSTNWCFVLVFMAELLVNLCWTLAADILLYVVIPTRRATASAVQLFVSHALGDAGSPYLVGVFSEIIKEFLRNKDGSLTADIIQYYALQYALLITTLIALLGGIVFLITAVYIMRDRKKAENIVSDLQRGPPSSLNIML